jgi:hypothetical protein
MRFLSCLLITLSAVAASPGQPVVEIFVPPVSGIDFVRTFAGARGLVNEIYSQIGVRVLWRSARSAPSGCVKEAMHWKIILSLQAATPEGVSANAMAFTLPYATKGPCVKLLMDRLTPAVSLNPAEAKVLLGYVLAHEIGHILQRIIRHSETGVMKAGWSKREIMYMSKYRLQFTPYDKDLILGAFASPAILRAGDEGKNLLKAEVALPGGPR